MHWDYNMDTAKPPGQQYNLKWTNHTNNMLQVFQQHLIKESFVDVTISCEGCFIKAHKLVLSACSVYFEQLFDYHTVPHPLIIMNGIKFNDLKQVIEFMYRGEIKVSETDLDSLLLLAESMQVKGLSNVRSKHLPRTDNKPPEPPVENPRKRRRSSTNIPDENINNTANGEDAIVKQENEEEEDVPLKFKNIMEHVPAVPKEPKRKPKPEPKTEHDITTTSKIPRPPNAFMIFANEWRKKIAEEHPNESNKDISVRLGTMWKSLNHEVKDTYYVAAKRADEEHKLKYPGYYYSPKEARERKAAHGIKKGTKFVDASNLVKLVMPSDISENDDSSRNSNEEEADVLEVPVKRELLKLGEDDNPTETNSPNEEN